MVSRLNTSEESHLNTFKPPHFGFPFAFHKSYGHKRCYPSGVEDTGRQRKEYCKREEPYKLAQRTGNNLCHREEHTGDRASSQSHRHKKRFRRHGS